MAVVGELDVRGAQGGGGLIRALARFRAMPGLPLVRASRGHETRCGWFGEGLDLPDLIEATTLLDALS